MYIKQEDFNYLEGLYKSLDETQRNKLLAIITKAASKRIGEEVNKINVVDDSIFDKQGFEPGEFITRTIIKKAYKEAKGVK
jgi:hypothetical protein